MTRQVEFHEVLRRSHYSSLHISAREVSGMVTSSNAANTASSSHKPLCPGTGLASHSPFTV